MVEYQDEARLTKIHEVAIRQCSTRAQRSDICETGRARPIEATVEGVAQAKGASVQEEGVQGPFKDEIDLGSKISEIEATRSFQPNVFLLTIYTMIREGRACLDAHRLLLWFDPKHKERNLDTPCVWSTLRDGIQRQLDTQRDLYEALLGQAQVGEGPSTLVHPLLQLDILLFLDFMMMRLLDYTKSCMIYNIG